MRKLFPGMGETSVYMGRHREGHRNAGIHATGIQIFIELLN